MTAPLFSQWQSRLGDAERAALAPLAAFSTNVIAPFAQRDAHERGPMPRDIVAQWAALGMIGLQTPTASGGLGASYFAKICAAQAIARSSFACAFSLNNIQSVATRIARFGTDEQRRRWLPAMLRGECIGSFALTEPGAGSDLGAITTTARRVDGGWVLDGEKAWITNGAIVDLLLVLAQTGQGVSGIGGFLVAMNGPGVERLAAHAVSAGHAVGAAGVRLRGCVVADDDVIHAPGDAFKVAMGGINGARTHVAAMCVAMLEQSLALAVDYAGRRQAFGVPLIRHQGLRWQLADVATELEAANQLVYRAAELIDAGAESSLAAAHAKKFAVGAAQRGIAACAQAMGAQAMLETYPIGRHLADIRLAAYVDGTTEMQNERIGQLLAARYGLAS